LTVADSPISNQSEPDYQAIADEAIKAEFRAQEAARIARAQLIQIIDTSEDSNILIGAELSRCERDFFYWVENYVWIEDPFNVKPKIPMLLYPYQMDACRTFFDLAAQVENSTKQFDVLIEKSREMGWTWLCCVLSVWEWAFKGRSSLFGSRTMLVADKLGDMKSILEKCRYIIREMPDWMLPVHFHERDDLGECLLRHGKGAAVIAADAASTNFGRGDRKLFGWLDEIAHWPYDAASCTACSRTFKIRAFISTPNGPFGRFAQYAGHSTLAETDADYLPPCEIRIRTHWRDHPIKGAGQHQDAQGKWTSPWYEQACKGCTADEIARELDIGYERSMKGLVFTEYRREIHSCTGLKPDPRKYIIRIWDPGVDCFFVLWIQVDSHGRVLCLREHYATDARIHNMAQVVKNISEKEFPGYSFIDVGDVAGGRVNNSGQDHPEFITLRDDYQIYVNTSFWGQTPTTMWEEHKHAVIHGKLNESFLTQGTMGLLIDRAKCPSLDRALVEGYRWKVDKNTKQVQTGVIHDVHPYVDAVDCLSYGIIAELGLGATSKTSGRVTKVQSNVVKWNKYRQGVLKGIV
jgi:hypothetical protein